MRQPTKHFVALMVIATSSVVMLGVVLRHRTSPSAPLPVVRNQPLAVVTNPPPPAVVTNTKSAATGILPNYPDFQERPLPVAYESPKVQWTLADGKDTNVIRQLAHNHLEYDRMVEENPRIFRRQLVYLKETAASVFEQAKLTGQPVRQLTLPGVGGVELQFEIVKGDNHGSSRQGMFSGHLVGNPDSLVTLAFEDGRQAFTILSPKDDVYIVGEPREPGQVMVKQIDPDTYGVKLEEEEDSARPGPARK